MPSAVITVSFINQPKAGKKNGSVKTADGVMFSVPGSMLGLFQPKGTYELQYEDSNFNGQTYHMVKSVKQAAVADPPKAQSNMNSDTTAFRIFMSGGVNNALASGKIDPLSPTDIGLVMDNLAMHWHRIAGLGKKGSQDMEGDDVPY